MDKYMLYGISGFLFMMFNYIYFNIKHKDSVIEFKKEMYIVSFISGCILGYIIITLSTDMVIDAPIPVISSSLSDMEFRTGLPSHLK